MVDNMQIPALDIDVLTDTQMLKPDSCSHSMTKKYLASPEDVWYCKEATDPMRARYEVLGQEFYRLFIATQPVMRLAKKTSNEQYFVLSKEIPDFRPIPFQKQIRFTNGIYTGLGQILIVSIFLHEIDLNLGNLGLDRHNRLVKIDGDWSFASFVNPELLEGKASDITPALLSRLPYLTHYDAHNWLDVIQKGTEHSTSELFSDELMQTPYFRSEINAAMLQIILLPDSYVHQFINLYLPENTETLTAYLIQRKNQLQQSAVRNTSFIQFLSTPAATDTVHTHLHQIKHFSTADALSPLNHSEYEDFESEYLSYWAKFRGAFVHSPQTVADLDAIQSNDLFENDNSIDIETASSISREAPQETFRMFSVTPSKQLGDSPLRFNRTFSNLSSFF